MDGLPPPVSTAAAGLREPAAPALPRRGSRAEIEAAATEFEGFFLSQMLQIMFSGIRTDGPFGGGQAEGAYRSMLMQEYGKVLAKSGSVGIADAVKAELLRLQEVQT